MFSRKDLRPSSDCPEAGRYEMMSTVCSKVRQAVPGRTKRRVRSEH